MRKKKCVMSLVCGSLIALSACVDENYNLDNLDKDAVFSPKGINLPVGEVEKIIFYDEIKKSYDDLLIENDGTLYVLFDGNFDGVEIPTFNSPDDFTGDPISIDANQTVPAIAGWNAVLPIDVEIAQGTESFEMGEPSSTDPNWTIQAKRIEFQTCKVYAKVSLTGVTFNTSGSSNPAKLRVILNLPEGFKIVNSTKRVIEETVDVSYFQTKSEYILRADIESYNYSETQPELSYSVQLLAGDAKTVMNVSSAFKFSLLTGTENMVPKIVTADVKAKQSFTGKIKDMASFFDSFEDDKFSFENPELKFSLTTNIGLNFNIDMTNGLVAQGPSGTEALSIKPAMSFVKNPINQAGQEKTTSYWLAQKNAGFPADYYRFADWNALFDVKPEVIDYSFNLNSTDDNAYITFNGKKSNATMSAAYTLKVPFSFTNLDFMVSDTIMDVFSEDMYDNFFKNSKSGDYLEIGLDEMDVVFNKVNEGDLTLKVNAIILSENKQVLKNVQATTEPESITNGMNKKLSIKITGLQNLKDAKHILLDFALIGGTDTKPVKLTDTDYIHIKKLRFIASGGYHFEM